MPGIFPIHYAGTSTSRACAPEAKDLFPYNSAKRSLTVAAHFQVLVNGVANVRQCLFLGGSLRPAAGQSGTAHTVALFSLAERHRILHRLMLPPAAELHVLQVSCCPCSSLSCYFSAWFFWLRRWICLRRSTRSEEHTSE